MQPALALAFDDFNRLRVTGDFAQGIAITVVHRRGCGHWAGVEGLHLVGAKAVLFEPNREVHHVLVPRARVRGDEVRD